MSYDYQHIEQHEIDKLEMEAIDFYERYGEEKWRHAFELLAAEFRELKMSRNKDIRRANELLKYCHDLLYDCRNQSPNIQIKLRDIYVFMNCVFCTECTGEGVIYHECPHTGRTSHDEVCWSCQ